MSFGIKQDTFGPKSAQFFPCGCAEVVTALEAGQDGDAGPLPRADALQHPRADCTRRTRLYHRVLTARAPCVQEGTAGDTQVINEPETCGFRPSKWQIILQQ